MKIAIAGEGRPALLVARELARRGLLSVWYTEQAGQPGVERVISSASARSVSVEALNGGLGEPLLGDWLLTVNTTVILPATVIAAFSGNVLNLHNGPLPGYAGRHVTQWGIRNGETRFASTIHFVAPEIDTGDIVAEVWYDIGPEDTGLAVFDRSFKAGVDLMMRTVERLVEGKELERRPQDPKGRRLYRHRDALDPWIDWTWEARRIVDFVRAGNYAPLTSPTYTATIGLPDGPVQVLKARIEPASEMCAPGTVVAVDAGGLTVRCANGAIRLMDLRASGSRLTALPRVVMGDVLSGAPAREGAP